MTAICLFKRAILLTWATQCVYFFHHCPAVFFFFWDHLTTPSIVYLWFSPEPLPVEPEVSFCMRWGYVFFHILKHKMFPYGRILVYIFNVVNSLRALLSVGSQLFQCVFLGRRSVVCGSLQVPSWWEHPRTEQAFDFCPGNPFHFPCVTGTR